MSRRFNNYFICAKCNVRILGIEEGFCYLCLRPIHLSCLPILLTKDQFFSLAENGFKFACEKCDNILTDVGRATLSSVSELLLREANTTADHDTSQSVLAAELTEDNFIPPQLFVNKGSQTNSSKKHKYE